MDWPQFIASAVILVVIVGGMRIWGWRRRRLMKALLESLKDSQGRKPPYG